MRYVIAVISCKFEEIEEDRYSESSNCDKFEINHRQKTPMAKEVIAG
jgi:hypothetical protein